MNYPIVCVLSGPESTRAKAELVLEKARLTIIPSKEWPIARESYRAEHWPHLTALPSGQEPDEDHGFLAVLAETEAAFHAAYRVVEKAKWVLRVHYELPERPQPREDPFAMLLQRMDAQEQRIAELTRKLGGQPSIGGAGFETGAGEFMSGAGASYSAAQMRRSVFGLAARAGTTVGSAVANTPGAIVGGLYSATDMQLSAAVSGLVVYTSVGECLIPGQEANNQGGSHGFLSSQNSTTLATANGSNPRIDLICATSADSGYTIPTGGTSGYVTLQAVTGTPTGGANLTNLDGAPPLPLSSLLLGYVLVPAAAMNLTSGDIKNVAAPFLISVSSIPLLGLPNLALPAPSLLTTSGSVDIPAGAGHMKVSLAGGGGGGAGGGSTNQGGGGGGAPGFSVITFASLSGVSGPLTWDQGNGGAGGAAGDVGGLGSASFLEGTGLATIGAQGGDGGAANLSIAGGSGGILPGVLQLISVSNGDTAAAEMGGWGGSYGGTTTGAPGSTLPGFFGGGGGGGNAFGGSGSANQGAGGAIGQGGNGGVSGQNGANATGYSSGGGGGSAAGGTGGNGSPGYCVIEWLP